MRIARSFIVSTLIFPFLFGGCATLEVAREVQNGRRAMQLGNPKAAIPHFEAAAQLDPDYLTDFTLLDIGIWSYVGMAQFEEGEKGKALASFKQAKQRHREDHFARVFLGLVMSQNGDRRAGKGELVASTENISVLPWNTYSTKIQFFDRSDIPQGEDLFFVRSPVVSSL